ncbi:MAG: hypothetical protein JWN98_1115 [Abditibacteriota bacterium]|nr:hypothetical protein [Abditibacteriota bacterium]
MARLFLSSRIERRLFSSLSPIALTLLAGVGACNFSRNDQPAATATTPADSSASSTPTVMASASAAPLDPPQESPLLAPQESPSEAPIESPSLSPIASPSPLGSSLVSPLSDASPLSDLPLRFPAPGSAPQLPHSRIAALKGKISRARILAAYRELAEIYVVHGQYALAAQTYREEAAEYRRKGLMDAAIIEELKAARYDPKTQLFLERAATQRELDSLYSGAPAEPFTGCYISAFIDRDPKLSQTFFDENFQLHRTPEEWERVSGKPHGSLWMYLAYGQKFPRAWIARLKAAGVVPHIAWEPKSLAQVRNDAYLRSFAQACREMDWPIMIRFASEMNGRWTPYHGNPKLYREKFALVHKVLHRFAPRVATIWCVNNPPLGNAHDYYPGDNNCDWVGVNFYSVPYYENKRNRPAFEDSPLALLDPIYKRYAARKPIAICEFAASHRAAIDNRLRNDFAIQKMSILYGALPRLYPRVKMVGWFNMNTLRLGLPGKTLNDYTLTDQRAVLNTYRRIVASPYFLGRFQTLGDPRPPLPRPLIAGTTVRGIARFSVWSNFQLSGAQTYFQFGPKIVYASARPGAHEINLDLARGPFGRQIVTASVYDARDRLVSRVTSTVNITR